MSGTQARGDVGAVVIGRNEGARLVTCLAALRGDVGRIVYVDSGSSDGSVAAAEKLGAEVIRLDTTQPFTAARARNAGLAVLAESGPEIRYVQFLDGDCEMRSGWIDMGRSFLAANPAVAVVCGRRRERYPGASVYNRLCDWEWGTPVGRALACGGDAMIRMEAITAAGGYRADLIAGEEPELCLRLRRAGWEIWRLDAEMTWHDAAITRFGQWWQRSRRAGHAFAEGAALHGHTPERHWVAETRRALIWGLGVPVAALVLGALTPVGFGVLLAYPAQVARLAIRGGSGSKAAWERAFFTVLGKFPEVLGVLRFHVGRRRGRRAALIEYK